MATAKTKTAPRFELSLALKPHTTRDQLASTLEALARMLRQPETVSSGGQAGCVNYAPGSQTAGTFREGHGHGPTFGEWSGAPEWDAEDAQRKLQAAWVERSKPTVGDFPISIDDAGRTFYRTGKLGTDRRTGEQSAEYEADNKSRLWANQAGTINERNA